MPGGNGLPYFLSSWYCCGIGLSFRQPYLRICDWVESVVCRRVGFFAQIYLKVQPTVARGGQRTATVSRTNRVQRIKGKPNPWRHKKSRIETATPQPCQGQMPDEKAIETQREPKNQNTRPLDHLLVLLASVSRVSHRHLPFSRSPSYSGARHDSGRLSTLTILSHACPRSPSLSRSPGQPAALRV